MPDTDAIRRSFTSLSRTEADGRPLVFLDGPGGAQVPDVVIDAMADYLRHSNANIDAIGADGFRYQIKGRRMTRHNGSRQLSAIRDLAGSHFDFLAGVLFAEGYTVLRAAIIPRTLITERAAFVARTNSHKFMLRDDVWDAPGVRDVTDQLRALAY